jgi:excinuclease ABC subunit B
VRAQDGARYEAMCEKRVARELRRLEKEMVACAKNLEFEKAAKLRDQLVELKKRLFGVALQSE